MSPETFEIPPQSSPPDVPDQIQAVEPAVEAPVTPDPAQNNFPSDYPRPAVLNNQEPLIWAEDEPAAKNYPLLGQRVAAAGDVYRLPAYASALLLAAKTPNIPPTPIRTAAALAAVIADRVPVVVVKDGKSKGSRIPSAHLATMLSTELFLQEFRPVDLVTRVPMYLGNFTLTIPGYNDGGRDQRVIYVGEPAAIARSFPTITAFLDAMPFATNADRSNAVAAAITVALRNFWPGAKPVVCVTGNKSHCGKDTIVMFAAGSGRVTSVTYQRTDWALERNVVGSLGRHSDTAILNVENARLANGEKFIASGFLERFAMDPEPVLFSTGTGPPVTRHNDLVLAITTNFGSLSTDLMNRALPIHLEAIGSIEDRQSAIGNPKLEYLPANRVQIDAELRGMIEIWKAAGRPLDETVRHPFSGCAKTVGGILRVNGFTDFLGNYSSRKAVDDPLRKALGLLGAYRPNAWLPAADWAKAATTMGLVKRIVPEADRDSDQALARGIGVVFSAHQDETLIAETDDERVTLRLKRARRRFENGRPSTRYQFEVLARTDLPADEEVPDTNVANGLSLTEAPADSSTTAA